MASNFPSSLDSFTNPSSSDAMDSVSVPHATQHSDLNDAVEALQAKVGADSSGVASSHDYKIAQLESLGTAVAFTPSWINLTPGDATETWYYVQVNDFVHVYGDTTFGSTTSIGGSVSMTVPVGTISSGAALAGTPNGRARCTDSNAGPLFVMTAVQVSSATLVTFCPETIGATFVQRGGVVTATYPFTWATGDRFNASFVYQIA